MELEESRSCNIFWLIRTPQRLHLIRLCECFQLHSYLFHRHKDQKVRFISQINWLKFYFSSETVCITRRQSRYEYVMSRSTKVRSCYKTDRKELSALFLSSRFSLKIIREKLVLELFAERVTFPSEHQTTQDLLFNFVKTSKSTIRFRQWE